jgi:hypothetical protein
MPALERLTDAAPSSWPSPGLAAAVAAALARRAGHRVAQLPQPDHRPQPPDRLELALREPVAPRVPPALHAR